MNKILIVEDDQIVANIYRNKLSVEGFEVEIASDGQAGLEYLHRFKPDVMLLDLMLPKLTGVDLLKKVRAEPGFQKLPIVVFSNTYLSNLVQEAWKAGATKCLSKTNCTPKQLVDVLRSTLASNGAGTTPLSTSTPAPQPVPSTPVPAPAPSAPQRPSQGTREAELESRLQKSLLESLPASVMELRNLLQALVKADNDEARLKQVQEMYRRVHALTGNAGMAGLLSIAQLADAAEALLKELYDKPKHINASILRTLASAVDLLPQLSLQSGREEKEPASGRILVVDDEAISRRAVTYSLDKAKLKSTNVEDPNIAYNLLAENRFDLIILDVDMPGMNGFELCSKLRMLPPHKKTPVIFVTSLNDFESRTNSMVSGGNDFIAKPFLFMELAVKALGYVLRGRLSA